MTREDDITTDDTADDLPTDPDELLRALEDGIAETHRKAINGRVHSVSNERCRQGWFRTLAYLCQTHSQIRREKDLEELAERLNALEDALESDNADTSAWWATAPAEATE